MVMFLLQAERHFRIIGYYPQGNCSNIKLPNPFFAHQGIDRQLNGGQSFMSSNLFRRSSSRRKGYRTRRRRKRNLYIAAAVVLSFTLLGLLLWNQGMFPANQAAEEWYEIQSRQTQTVVQLPQDDAAHNNYMEWWYYNGQLETDSGDRYYFHFAFFVVDTMVTQSVAHLSLLENRSGRHYTDQKITPGKPSRHIVNGFDFNLQGWQLAGGNGSDKLEAGSSEFRLKLHLAEASPPVMHDGSGLLDFGTAGSSYYYSRPRMEIQGELELGGEKKGVTGVAWFDHQWGDFDVNQLGWDWFALQLDDGTDIMIYLLFDSRHQPVLQTASFTQEGKTALLTATEIEVAATEQWVSERSGIAYPMGWRVNIPSREMALMLKPVIKASEFDGRATTNKVYWEGAVEIGGTHSGRGFVEMSGYDSSRKETLNQPVKEKSGTFVRQ